MAVLVVDTDRRRRIRSELIWFIDGTIWRGSGLHGVRKVTEKVEEIGLLGGNGMVKMSWVMVQGSRRSRAKEEDILQERKRP